MRGEGSGVCGEGLVGLGGVTTLHMQRKPRVIRED